MHTHVAILAQGSSHAAVSSARRRSQDRRNKAPASSPAAAGGSGMADSSRTMAVSGSESALEEPLIEKPKPDLEANVAGDASAASEEEDMVVSMPGQDEKGIYLAVLHAAFGALHMRVEKEGGTGAHLNVRLHPIFVFVLVLPMIYYR